MFIDKTFLIWGKGKSGLGAKKLLDSKNIKNFIGSDDTENWEDYKGSFDVLVLSPGIAPSHPLWRYSLENNIEVIGELELAYLFYKGDFLIAITGTDGKSTVSYLTYLIFKKKFEDIEIGGNFGTPFSEILTKKENSKVVLEVSSFQGKTIKTFRPNIGVFLNLSPDHLDWHENLEDYFLSKQNIFKNQTKEDVLILKNEDPVRKTISEAKKIFFGENSDLFVKDNKVFYEKEPFLDLKNVRLKGAHNLYNIAVASLIGYLKGVSLDDIYSVIESFEGLPFRMSFLGEIKNRYVYNDSKSTTPNALKAALSSFEKNVILIAGGILKSDNLKDLKPLIKEKVKAIILIGRDKEKMREDLKGSSEIYLENSLEEAVYKAFEISKEKDIILFSPACASFDMFNNYQDRGNKFSEIVRCLATS